MRWRLLTTADSMVALCVWVEVEVTNVLDKCCCDWDASMAKMSMVLTVSDTEWALSSVQYK